MTIHEAMKIDKRSDGYYTDCKKFKTYEGAVRYNKKCGFDENGNSLNPPKPLSEEEKERERLKRDKVVLEMGIKDSIKW